MPPSVPVPTSSASSAATGIRGTAMAAVSRADPRLHAASRRLGGTRSTIPDSSVPANTYGKKPSVKVSEANSGDRVRSKTSTVRTTAEMTVPVIARTDAANSARNSGTARAAEEEAPLDLLTATTVLHGAGHRKRFVPGRILMRVTAFAAQRQDLGTVRFAWSPAWETLAAVRMFIDPRGRPYHESWRTAVAQEAARLHLAPLFAINPLRG